MEEDIPKNRPTLLIIVSIVAIAIVVLVLLYQPSEKIASDSGPAESSDTGTMPESTVELNAEIVLAERRENDYYIQVQTNDTFEGDCVFTLVPVDEGERVTHAVKLEPADRVSACESFFSLKGLNPGKYDVKVAVTAKDGRTTNLSEIMAIE